MRLEQWFFQLTQRADSEALVAQHVSVAGAWDLGALLAAAGLLAVLAACCCLLPGLRRRRTHSAIAVLWSAVTGCSLVCVYSNPSWAWLGGRATTAISYTNPARVDCLLSVRFGLHGADLRLDSPTGRFHYRDQLEWPLTPRGMTELYRGALRRGLAVPLVTALEVLSKDAGPCTYGRHFRRAGYITSWLVASALAVWVASTLLLGTVPKLAAKTMCWNGILATSTAGIYVLLMPSHNMQLRIDGVIMRVHMAWCFWLLLSVGLLNLALGGWMMLQERRAPGYFASVFEVDFDYPVYRYGWPACGQKAPAVPGIRRNDLRLNIDFAVNDLSSAGQTPSEERFSTPSCTLEPSQPFWTPGSIPRRPPPSAVSPKSTNNRNPNFLYPPLEVTPTPSAPPMQSFQREGRSTCKRRTPHKLGSRRSLSAGRSVALPMTEGFTHTR